ncbi:hypothetical protein CTheo_4885 [Ceratobasidium theobromae]|uniref:Polysaccharide lyase 14 domain-containing protein n=1 Tax=Ceratobasidium theobromae TaxID=1582974 RepID=A0A5N5QK62_9AGAM|nr:hypothetical protein CTheo_4885 [Ceratobasidium theobromae]
MLDKLKSKLHPDTDNPAPESEPSLKPHHTIKPCHLFPVPVKHAFTTLPDCTAHEAHIRVLTLSDSALRVEKTTPGTSHQCVQVDGIQSWEALYPEGSINPQGKIKGGFGFYLCGPGGACAYESARDALFSYAIRFDEGFEFVKGGKIPGLYGGSTPELAYGCSGGRQESRDKCFSLRLMTNGAAEMYAYLPSTPANEAALKDVPPMTHRNPDFGWSVGRGCFKFQPGKWTTIAERVRLNEVGQANGIIQLWADGELVLDVQGLEIRVDKDVVFRGAHFQTFFGGKAQDWASPKDQCAHFGCISGAVLEEW